DTYTYSLIRIVPDSRRGEWINGGVVVYLADTLDVRLLANTTRLRALAPTLDIGFLQHLPTAWRTLCAGERSDEMRQSILAQLPVAHASPAGQFCADAGNYDKQVDAIIQDLVAPPPLPQR